jgi:hypothetical protein
MTDGMPKFVTNGDAKKLIERHAQVSREFISSSRLGQEKCPLQEAFVCLDVCKRRAAPIKVQLQYQ